MVKLSKCNVLTISKVINFASLGFGFHLQLKNGSPHMLPNNFSKFSKHYHNMVM